MKKSFIALFLMFVSVVSMAETSQGESFASTANDDNLARAEAGGEIVDSGTWGTCYWSLDANGNLIIWPSRDYFGCSFDGTIKDNFPIYYSSIKTVKFNGSNIYLARSCYRMFYECSELISVDFGEVNTSQVESMNEMFCECTKLKSLNLSNFDTSNVRSMNKMFYDCKRLESLDLSNFDTSHVTDMYRMFWGCSWLESLDLSVFDTSNVVNMEEMFKSCFELTSLILPTIYFNINTSNLFYNCDKLTNIILNDNRDFPEVYNADIVAKYKTFFASLPTISNCTLSVPQKNLLVFSNTGNWKYVFSHGNLGYGVAYACFWDIDKDGNLLVWPIEGGEGWIYRPTWEAYATNIKTVRFAGIIHAIGCYEMFKGLNQLTSIDFSCFDSSNVTDMREMFYGCSSLTSLDLSRFDTSGVTDMREMFYGCSGLTSLNLSNFDTSNVKNMTEMFYGCSSLTSLNLSNFDTSNVADMYRMFYGCKNLESLEFSNFTTINISDPYYIFYRCDKLKDLIVHAVTPPSMKRGTFDYLSSCTLHVPAESLLLYTCADEWKNLYSICSIGNIEHGIDGGCFWDIDKNGSLMVWPRNGVEGQISSDATWNSSQDCCKYIKTGRFAGTVYAPVDCSGLFAECNSLSSLDLSNLNTRYVANMSHMFENCRSLSSIDFSNFDTNNVTDMSYMFNSCESLSELDLSNFDTRNVENMDNMFENCRSLSSIDFSNFDTNNVTDMSYMFNSCESLSELDLSNFDTRNVENMDNMFRDCSSLDYLTLDRFFIPDWSGDIFYNTNPREIVFKSIPYIGSADLKRLDTHVILDLSDASYIHEDPNDFPSVIKATYTRPVTNKWGTIVLPFNARMGDTYDFYQVNSIKNDNLNLKKISALPAGTPAIFCVNDGETKLTCTLSYGMYFHINTNLNPVPAGELTLVGTFSELDITYREGFIIANDKFWNIQDIRGDNWVGIKPFRAYLAGSLSSGANSLGISFDDTEDVDAVDAISDVENGEMEYYDLNGRRLNRLQNGVNIVKLGNGQTKKIIVE